MYLCIYNFISPSAQKACNEHNRGSFKKLQILTEPHQEPCSSSNDVIMAQNASKPAFGDNFLTRKEHHSHYLEFAGHLFSFGLGPSLIILSILYDFNFFSSLGISIIFLLVVASEFSIYICNQSKSSFK